MSLKNPKNLLIIGAAVIALLAGTVLLASYANILPARSGAGSQAKTCPAAGGTTCCGAKVSSNENAQVAFAQQTGAGFDTEACPLGRTEPCCAGELVPGCCPKTCPPDCTKPCCAGEAAPDCCPMSSPSATTNTGCCPKTSNVTE
ncbi:MAG: hypothetical protein ACETWQ_14460 [Phycisphaerae bacterium]